MSFSDVDLVARVVSADDRNAFAELVRRHQSAVRALLRRLTCGDAALADDLAQDTFLRAYQGLAGFRGGARLSSWLYRIAYNSFLDDRARCRERPLGALAASERPDVDTQARPGAPALGVDLRRAMSLLTPAERAVVTLALGMEQTHQDVAAILDCPLGTVKTHISRARQKLQEQLEAWSAPELDNA